MRFLPFLLLAGCGTSIRDVRVAEDVRDSKSKNLAEAFAAEDAALRARAALAYGRIQDPDSIPALLDRLKSDPDATVRRAILFALGQMAFGEDYDGNPRGADAAALSLLDDPDAVTRATAVEALGKLGPLVHAEAVSKKLRDPAADVRGEAALALFRMRFVPVWSKRAKEPPKLSEVAVNALVDAAADPDPEVRWRVAYSMSRFGEKAAVAALRRLAADENSWARVFAVRALGRSGSADAADSIRVALGDPDAIVRAEAVTAAERLKAWNLLPADDPSFHVRAALARALASKESGHDDLLEKLLKDASLTVRCDALASRAARGGSVAESLSDPHWKVRKTVAGCGGLEVAEKAMADADRRVRAAAVEALGGLGDEKSGSLILKSLTDADLGIRIAAVGALAKRKDLPRLVPLETCYRASMKREDIELREEIATVAEEMPEAVEFLKTLLRDPAPSVRTKAYRALRSRGETVARPEPVRSEASPFLGVSFSKPPVVVLETEKGVIEIECFTSEAPIHVASFVLRAREGFYDGLIFHRVVSSFVVQGGDPRGDGSGDGGYNLRDEIGRTRYERGTLGMPKAGKDTGGCQIFITHTPTPHLDGNYTVFGRVAAGLDVVDKIEEGDKIIKARVRER